MIKILHVVPKISEGGVGKVVLNYLTVIDRCSFDFTILTHEEDSIYIENVRKKYNVEVICIQPIHIIGIRAYIYQLKAMMQSICCDIIHIHTGHLTGFYAFLFRKFGNFPIVLHAHTTKQTNNFHLPFLPLLRHFSRKYSNALIACGIDAGRFCFGKASYLVLPNALLLGRYSQRDEEKSSKLLQEIQVPINTRIIGNIAALINQKNQVFLLRVMKTLVINHPEYVLLLIGSGPNKRELQRTTNKYNIEKHVIFMGQRDDVNDILNSLDVFVLPSLFEGLPVSAIEAQASGIPSLLSDRIDRTTDIGVGLAEFLPIRYGVKDWVNAIIKYTNYRKPYTDIEYQLKSSIFNIQNSVKKLEQVYTQLVDENG